VKLLAREKLVKTGAVDYAEWNYRPILGEIQRLRFSLALSLLPARIDRLLEIGFGSGVLMPELKTRADQLYGIDVHGEAASVKKALGSEGVRANLVCSSAEALPFDAQFFDGIIAVSSLEFVQNLAQACREIRRTLKKTGVFVVITPAQSALVDAGLKILTGKSAKRDFGERREAIIPTLLRHFTAEEHQVAPPIVGRMISLYHAFRLV
jgi:ubiquinone/menaquinone biosynthesis C-methylase UbiE